MTSIVAALATTAGLTLVVPMAAEAAAPGMTYNGQTFEPMPPVPVNSCKNTSLPKSNGTGAPLPGDPSGFGFANATAMGWPGNYWAPISYLSGSYYARGVPSTYNGQCGAMYSFGVYKYGLDGKAPAGGSVKWTEADGYLPAMQTSFTRNGIAVTITDFANKQTIAGTNTLLVYTRITINNTTGAAVSVPPGASGPNLVTLAQAPDSVPAGATVTDDYVAAVDTFGATNALPTAAQISSGAQSYDTAYTAMKTFWNTQLQSAPSLTLPNITLPGTGLNNPGDAMRDAYKAAFIYTLIAQTGQAQFSGANNYNAVLNHDVPSILGGRFTAGNFRDARNLLLTARISEDPSFPSNGANWYWDGPWKTPSAWADYLRLSNDVDFVKAYFRDDANGPSPWGPSLYTQMHTYFLQQLDPATGYLKFSNDNDSGGTWLFDDESALAGLAGYRYIATRIGNTDEANWAATQYNLLLANVNKGLDANQQANGHDYLSCEVNKPTSANRCATPNDANWAASNQWGQNIWTIALQGGPLSGTLGNPAQTDNVYSMGFSRLKNQNVDFPSFGAYPGYTVALNTAYANAALYGNQYRSLPLTSYAWQLQNTTGGPNSWWEAVSAPASPNNPWEGKHTTPQFGASPYVWPMAGQTQSLQQALVADGLVASSTTGVPTYSKVVYVGRGVPDAWVTAGSHIAVDNLTTSYSVDSGARSTYGVSIDTAGPADANTVTVSLTGSVPTSNVQIQLPSFASRGVSSVTGGTFNAATGTVTLDAGRTSAQIVLANGAAPTVSSTVAGAGASKNILSNGQSATATVTVTNNSTAALTGSLNTHVPTGWSVTPATTDLGTVAGGATKTVTVTLRAPTNGVSRADVGFDVTWRGPSRAAGTVRSSLDAQSQPPLPVPAGSTNLAPSATPTASYTSPWENVGGINDGIYPQGPADATKKRWGTWPQKGPQWVQLEWAAPITTTGSSLYFLDDGGGVQVPESWTIQYWTGSAWADVPGASGYGTTKGAFNAMTHSTVTTTKLRAQLNSTRSGLGVMQWVVNSASQTPPPPPPSTVPTLKSTSSVQSTFNQNGDTYSIAAAGTDIWVGVDQYGALYQQASAGVNASVTARVDSQTNTDPWAKAGVVLRTSVPGAKASPGYAIMVATPGNGVSLQWDSNGNGDLDSYATAAAGTKAPVWVRLTRVSQTTVAGYYSTDGTTWIKVGNTVTVPGAAATQDAGLVVTSHKSGTTSTGTFSKFKVQ